MNTDFIIKHHMDRAKAYHRQMMQAIRYREKHITDRCRRWRNEHLAMAREVQRLSIMAEAYEKL